MEGRLEVDVTQAGWEFGMLPTAIPEAYGGFGDYSAVTGALAMEAFAYGDLALALGGVNTQEFEGIDKTN